MDRSVGARGGQVVRLRACAGQRVHVAGSTAVRHDVSSPGLTAVPDYGYSVSEYGTASSPCRKPGDTIDLMAESGRPPQDAAPAPGSPAWWSARAVPPPERGRGRPPRSF